MMLGLQGNFSGFNFIKRWYQSVREPDKPRESSAFATNFSEWP